MPYVCPFCARVIKSQASLDRHKESCKMNPEAQEKDTVVKNDTDEREDLTIKVDKEDDEAVYQCGDCGAAVTKGQAKCPGCGEALNWGN